MCSSVHNYATWNTISSYDVLNFSSNVFYEYITYLFHFKLPFLIHKLCKCL